MRFDADIEIVFGDGTELKVKMSELLEMAYDPIGQVGEFDKPWRAYVNKRLVAESNSWNAEPDPAELEKLHSFNGKCEVCGKDTGDLKIPVCDACLKEI
jgi:hypothetical protein